MLKPSHFGGYSDAYTVDCERVLVTLLRGLGPWKESVFLVGGLAPRYLVPQRPPDVPAHAGTLDVDIVIDLQLLTDTDAYHSLEDNLKRMGFERAVNEQGLKLSWRWQTRTEYGALMVLEFLADAPLIAGGRVQPLPTQGTISALNIPHASIVFDLHRVSEIRAQLLGENGVATECLPRIPSLRDVEHAHIVSFPSNLIPLALAKQLLAKSAAAEEPEPPDAYSQWAGAHMHMRNGHGSHDSMAGLRDQACAQQ